MQPTTAQTNLLRTSPHRTKLYLSVFQPTTVMSCQIITGSAVARNDYIIPYYNVTAGDYTAVEAGMTMLVGSTAGAEDVGRIRVRSVNDTQFTVAENSNIDWQEGQYLTILRYWEVWPVFPRIISDPSNPENTLWYKDYDIAYTNQNTVFGSFPCAGPHRAAFTGDSIYYSATGSYNVADVSMSYDWWFEGATVTGSSSLTPGNITYDTPGHYVTRLIISGSNGGVDKTYRYVSIYDRPETGSSNIPVSRWSMGTLNGSPPGGGYNVSFTIHETVDLHEGDVIVLFGESWYGDTKGTIGGNAVGNSNIFFVGHILKGSIQYNYRFGEVTFEVGSITEYMKEQEGFSISVESVASPAYWYQVYDLDFNKAIYHYLRWQSTVLYLTDLQSLVDDRPLQYYDSDRASLYDAIDNLVRGSLLGGVTADIQGKIWVEHGAQAFPSLSSQTYSDPVFEFKKQDWVGSPRIDEQFIPNTSYIEYDGIAFSGITTGTYSALLSNAPGSAPLYRGKSDRKSGLAIKSQTEINEISGNILANRNYPYQNISYQGRGTYRNIDIAPQEKYTLQVEASDTPRGIAISGSFMPNNIGWTYDAQNQSFRLSSLTFSPLITGTAGQTISIPAVPPDDGVTQPPRFTPSIPSLTYPALFSTFTTSDYIIFNIDLNPQFDNDFVTVDSVISERNSPVTWRNGAPYATLEFKTSGIYYVSATFSLLEDGVGPTDTIAMFFNSSFSFSEIFGMAVTEDGATDYSHVNIGGVQYIRPSATPGSQLEAGTTYPLLYLSKVQGTATEYNLFNSTVTILKLK